ncbi:MAG TPA: MarR family winged helix-turn-helix transcriptional regulator [Ramlibacter sp.]|nr:MarR family winged helix-turn-helix transcriptional regulator [Ramlibacter sp.]
MPKNPPATHPRIDGDEFVPALLAMVNNKIASASSDLYLRLFGVGLNEWRILSVLSNTPHSTTAHICETVAMHKAVASRSLRQMEAKGLVVVERSEDQQRVMALTPAGQAMHDEIAAIALERERRLMQGFTPKEQAQLREYLRRMRAELDAVNAWQPAADEPSRPEGG